MVNPDVDGSTKTLNQRKILQKTQINDNLLKTKRMLKPKYKPNWAWLFTFRLAGRNSPFLPLSVTLLQQTFQILIKN